jgi:low affinity Fe/Cu permease
VQNHTESSSIIIPGTPTTPTATDRFRQFAQSVAHACGSPVAFAAGVAVIVLWAITGPVFGYSEQWQLVVNTGTTIITFLMVFVIQNSQTRDSKEIHVKLDELLRAVETARNTIINCADLSDDELQQVETDLHKIAEKSARQEGCPEAGSKMKAQPLKVITDSG